MFLCVTKLRYKFLQTHCGFVVAVAHIDTEIAKKGNIVFTTKNALKW